MASNTGIANLAMRLLKANRITSLTDGSNNANAANDVFDQVRDALLRSHNWNFATKRAQLAQSATTPTFEFDYGYPLPSDWLKTISVHDNDAGAGGLMWREEEIASGGAIVTSASQVWIRYVYRVTDPNRMSADFRNAFSYELAVAMPGISNLSTAEAQRLEDQAARRLRKAMHTDASGSIPERLPRGSWVNSRSGYPNWRAWPDA